MSQATQNERDEFFAAYQECVLWTGLDYFDPEEEPRPLDDNYDIDDFSDSALAEMRQDCDAFIDANIVDIRKAIDLEIGYSFDQAGHDFSLTRDHHGAGFWDRGLGDIGDRLTESAQAYSEVGAYVGDDGKVYVGC